MARSSLNLEVVGGFTRIARAAPAGVHDLEHLARERRQRLDCHPFVALDYRLELLVEQPALADAAVISGGELVPAMRP